MPSVFSVGSATPSLALARGGWVPRFPFRLGCAHQRHLESAEVLRIGVATSRASGRRNAPGSGGTFICRNLLASVCWLIAVKAAEVTELTVSQEERRNGGRTEIMYTTKIPKATQGKRRQEAAV